MPCAHALHTPLLLQAAWSRCLMRSLRRLSSCSSRGTPPCGTGQRGTHSNCECCCRCCRRCCCCCCYEACQAVCAGLQPCSCGCSSPHAPSFSLHSHLAPAPPCPHTPPGCPPLLQLRAPHCHCPPPGLVWRPPRHLSSRLRCSRAAAARARGRCSSRLKACQPPAVHGTAPNPPGTWRLVCLSLFCSTSVVLTRVPRLNFSYCSLTNRCMYVPFVHGRACNSIAGSWAKPPPATPGGIAAGSFACRHAAPQPSAAPPQ